MRDSKTRKARLTLGALGVLLVGAVVGGGVVAATTLGGDDDSKGASTSPTPTSAGPSPSQSTDPQQAAMTPEKARKLTLETPTGQKDGLSTGFSKAPGGDVSTIVYFWEEYAFLDDQKARQQLDSIVSPDAPGYADELISEVRKLRESIGLAPSGGTPAGITFSTSVNAVRATSLTGTDGQVIQVWLNYDRYSTNADGAPDKDPLKDQDVDFLLKWQDGGWKITNEPRYWKKRSFARAYVPDSHVSWMDGWQQVRHAD
ncbi:hypothetical protein ACFVZD_36860 [Streptomyces sp. NPDC058287]|uniref:hypothetical protein n=1 Tax=Streptomyces sp. NPDC058287 TaxID=3346423 RepID=UPI0036E42F3C